MPATAKKTEPEKKPEAPPSIPITNIQKIGVLRFHAAYNKESPLGTYIEIKPGETVSVPLTIWKRYAERADIEAMDRVHFIVGGLKPGETMKTPNAQAQALALREKDVVAREAELAMYEAKLDQARQELEASKSAVHEGH